MQLIAPGADIVEALQRWRGTAQEHRDIFQLAAFHRHVPSGEAKTILLLGGTVVFLVDNDQAGRAQGVNTAERVPMTICALPSRAASHER